jgi:NADH:ubiquinone oxidoreductase subunit C
MNSQEISALLIESWGSQILESQPDALTPYSVVESSAILKISQFLRSDERLLMDHLELLGGADYKDRIEIVYVLYSMRHYHRYMIKCRLPRETPVIPSVESVWSVANCHEREAYDM